MTHTLYVYTEELLFDWKRIKLQQTKVVLLVQFLFSTSSWMGINRKQILLQAVPNYLSRTSTIQGDK